MRWHTGMEPRREHPVPWLRISHINTVSQDHQGLAVAKALWRSRRARPRL